MPQPHLRSRKHETERLAARVEALDAARARLRLAHHQRSLRGYDERLLQADLLVALEAYAAAIADLGAPLSYRVRAEIDLYRCLSQEV